MLAFIFDVLQFVVRSYVAELRFMWCVNGLCVYPHAQGKLSKVGGAHTILVIYREVVLTSY